MAISGTMGIAVNDTGKFKPGVVPSSKLTSDTFAFLRVINPDAYCRPYKLMSAGKAKSCSLIFLTH